MFLTQSGDLFPNLSLRLKKFLYLEKLIKGLGKY